MKNYKNIDQYIKSFSKSEQEKLRQMRDLVLKLVPSGEEAIRYGMPTLRLNNKNLLHYATFKNHFGFYPAPSGIKAFQKELSKYVTSKGAIQFPIDKPLPINLIIKIVKFRVKEELLKSKT